MTGTDRMTENDKQMLGKAQLSLPWIVWPLHVAKVGYFFSPSLLIVKGLILRPLPFFFYQKSFIFRFLANCFGEANLYNTVG